MLGTLLEATPDGQDWPSARDTRSLLAGGLRARAAGNARLAPAVSLRQAALFGLSLYVVQQVGLRLFNLDSTYPIRGGTATILVSSGLLVAAVIAAWRGRRLLTAVAAVAACAALAYYATLGHDHYHLATIAAGGITPAQLGVPSVTAAYYLLQLPLALAAVALAFLARRDARPPLTWLWLPALLLAEMAWCHLSRATFPFVQYDISVTGPLAPFLQGTSLLFVLPILLWLVTDTRPALGLAAFLATLEVNPTIGGIQAFLTAGSPSQLRESRAASMVLLVLMLALTAGLARLLRRQNRPHLR
jgi:hypothetical protein